MKVYNLATIQLARTTKLSILSAVSASVLAIAACGSDTSSNNNNNNTNAITCADGTCTVPAGNYDTDLSWTADNVYQLQGKVFIGDGTEAGATTLTIEAGTRVEADANAKAYLAILPYSKIIADGRADAPIVFTSNRTSKARGDWGGLIISGNAPVNCGGTATTCLGEGDTGSYGGTNPNDNSGILRYVRVEFGGNQVNPTDELNGISFQGVGDGTVVDYVQVHKSKDDGVEFFGGTVNVKHLILTGIGDDSLDWTFGWQGNAQFVVIQQHDDESDNGIEADNNGDNNAATPRSNPTLSNFTIVGSPSSDKSDIGILLRAGTGAFITNTVVAGFNDACADIDDIETFTNAGGTDGTPTGNLTIQNSVLWCPGANTVKDKATADEKGPADPFSASDFVLTAMSDVMAMDPGMSIPMDQVTPDYSMSAVGLPNANMPTGTFFETVNFIGGIGSDDWTAGWTAFPAN